MKNTSKLLAGFLLALIMIGTVAARTVFWNGATLNTPTIGCETLVVDETMTATGTLTATAGIVNNGTDVRTSTASSLTSPSVTSSAAGATVLSVTTDVTQTGLIVTGGTQWQVLVVRGTSDSATIRVDDGTASMTLTGNAVLGLDDILVLLGTSADGDEWAEVSRSLN